MLSKKKDTKKTKVSDGAKPPVLVILGSTSAGKTSLAVRLAASFGGEIVSADSRQVYRGMDIGTGKDLAEYRVGRKLIPYHLIDVVDPNQNFDLAEYCCQARAAIDDITSRGRLPIVCGGSGLYLQALVDNYQLPEAKPNQKQREELEALGAEELLARLSTLKPEFAARLNNSDRNNKRRLIRYLEIAALESFSKNQLQPESPEREERRQASPYDFLVIGLDYPDDILKRRIRERLESRFQEGMLLEVEQLHEGGVSWERFESFGLEYRFLSRYLRQGGEYEELFEKLATAIYRFAKRQKTWFRRWQKQGREIAWVSGEKEAKALLRSWLKGRAG